ncbi:MAG: molybdopterin oxidoreductase family protein [Byssovorax sp.]
MAETHHAICPLCDAICGITVEVEGGRLTKVRGDEDDPFSRGYICPKATALPDIHQDPDRIVTPMRREGSRWIEARWDEALPAIGRALADIQRRHGRDAVAIYSGTPVAQSYAALLFGLLFGQSLGTKNLYTASSVDTRSRLLASTLLYGNQATIPVPDLDRVELLLIVGANPVVSNGCTMTAPGARKRLLRIRERGGKVWVIDPRRTETAAIADRHCFVRPGTDALLLAAMIRTILAEGLASPGALAPRITGLDRLRAALDPFHLDAVSAATGIAAPVIRELAQAFARSPAAAAYGRMGTTVQAFGTTTSFLLDALNIVTGNLDRPGGSMFASPAVDLGKLARMLGQAGASGRWKSRVGGFPEQGGELPVAALADEIETPGPGQIRALVTFAGNPVLSLPNGRRMDRALSSLDFMVSIDLYRNETTRHATWILPPSFALERDHYPLLFHALAVRNTAHYARAALPRPAGTRHDWEIFLGLIEQIGLHRGGLAALAARAQAAALGKIGPQGMLRALLRLGGKVRLDDLLQAPHGVDLGPLEPRIAEVVHTPGGTIDLGPRAILDDLVRLRRAMDPPSAEVDDRLLLIGRRDLRSNNSWMHNSRRLIKGPPRCTLLMGPADAAARGLVDGQRVTITSEVSSVIAPLSISDEVMPGVVSLPHGFGHDRPGVQLDIASAHAGVSANDLTDERRVDPVSGVSVLNGIPVTVRAADR